MHQSLNFWPQKFNQFTCWIDRYLHTKFRSSTIIASWYKTFLQLEVFESGKQKEGQYMYLIFKKLILYISECYVQHVNCQYLENWIIFYLIFFSNALCVSCFRNQYYQQQQYHHYYFKDGKRGANRYHLSVSLPWQYVWEGHITERAHTAPKFKSFHNKYFFYILLTMYVCIWITYVGQSAYGEWSSRFIIPIDKWNYTSSSTNKFT